MPNNMFGTQSEHNVSEVIMQIGELHYSQTLSVGYCMASEVSSILIMQQPSHAETFWVSWKGSCVTYYDQPVKRLKVTTNN